MLTKTLAMSILLKTKVEELVDDVVIIDDDDDDDDTKEAGVRVTFGGI